MRKRQGRDGTVIVEYEKGVSGKVLCVVVSVFPLGSFFFLRTIMCVMKELMMYLLLRRLFSRLLVVKRGR